MEERILQLQVEGLSNLRAKLVEYKDQRRFIMFIGAIDQSGDSWCPDCRDAEPVVEKALEKAPSSAVFILVVTGDKPTWKNPENEFRIDPEFKLTGIPTLMEYKTTERLEPDQCKDQSMVDKLLLK